MENKVLIIYVPVLHKGFLDLFKKNSDRISAVYIIDNDFLAELSETKPDIASFAALTSKDLIEKLGFKNIFILSKDNLDEVKNKEIILVQDEISRNLADKYLAGAKIEWQSVFLRWDRTSILIEKPPENIVISNGAFDIEMMGEAKKEMSKTGDWWRQIGAVLVKDKKIILRGYNKDLPSDHTPYQVGEVRDFFKTGERQDLASTIHAEQSIIAQAAKKGISLEGTSLYVTTFPCPVCAKLIAYSGIKNLYFSEGGSNFDAQKVLVSAGVQITCVPKID
ncbi:MAG: deaminase [Candidatus Wildermuthbacteria bacterium]|nr:deaminase [Candidatus Wildermuthbacteria bacterium]